MTFQKFSQTQIITNGFEKIREVYINVGKILGFKSLHKKKGNNNIYMCQFLIHTHLLMNIFEDSKRIREVVNDLQQKEGKKRKEEIFQVLNLTAAKPNTMEKAECHE